MFSEDLPLSPKKGLPNIFAVGERARLLEGGAVPGRSDQGRHSRVTSPFKNGLEIGMKSDSSLPSVEDY